MRSWISSASAGAEGVSRVEQHLPDLVLLDYSLPDINGDEVCQRLLANKKTARIPIVMMSGHVLEMNLGRGSLRKYCRDNRQAISLNLSSIL